MERAYEFHDILVTRMIHVDDWYEVFGLVPISWVMVNNVIRAFK